MHLFATLILCLLLHITTLSLISFKHTSQIRTIFIQIVGVSTSIFTLHLPYQHTHLSRLIQCPLRVICFFYGFKTLDLALCRSENPPTLVISSTKRANAGEEIVKNSDHFHYIWLLLSEMRYQSFDIAIKQNSRPPLSEQSRDIPSSLFAVLIAGLITLAFPLGELMCLTLLLLVRLGFEILHLLVHPSCKLPLFYRPFSTPSMSAFWTTHWHACAAPFLNDLGYKPGREYVGRWFGVLAAFNLSGIWHGYVDDVST